MHVVLTGKNTFSVGGMKLQQGGYSLCNGATKLHDPIASSDPCSTEPGDRAMLLVSINYVAMVMLVMLIVLSFILITSP